MDYKDDKTDIFDNQNNSSHLDDIDKFFYKNFVNLIDNSNEFMNKNDKVIFQNINLEQKVLSNEENNNVEILNFDDFDMDN